ncbi:MAG: PAS domain S-box protein, partial [bacterium]
IIGKTNRDYCRKTGRDHGIAENRERWYRRTFEEKKTFGFIESLKTKTGEVKHFLRRFKPIIESDGEVRKIIAYGLDMTEHERTQIALRESEERYRSLVELSPDAVIVHRDGKIVFINAAGARAVGANSPEELLGRPIVDFVHPDYRKFAQEKIRRMAKGEETPRVEEKFLRLDGTSFDVEIAARPITFDGQPAFQVICHDITGRKRTQAQLQASYHLTDTVSRAEDIDAIYQESLSGLERTLGADRSAILLIDSDGEMRFKAWRGLSRHYRQAVAGHAPWPPSEKNPQPLLIPNVEDEPAIETFRPVILDEGIRAVAFIPLLYQGRLLGKLMIYYNNLHPFSAEEVQLAQTIARHVAFAIARKKSEQDIRQSEQRYRTLVERMPDGVYRSTPVGKFLEVNPAFVKILGYESKEALLAVDIEKKLYFDPQERQRVVDSLRQAGKEQIKVFRLRHKDGHEIWVEDHGRLVCDAKGAVRYHEGILRDVTERKRAQEEHRRLEAQIQHAQKLESLGVLAGGIAHDFNNLLTGILGNASLALMDIAPASPTHECLEDIEKAAKRAADLCNQMLAYSGKGRFVVEPLRLSIVTEEMAHLLKTSISKKVVLKYEFYPNLPAIQADATQIRQVVMNLVINASDAIGDSPGVITVRTGVLACDDHFFREVYLGEELPVGQYVYLEVTDTGCGMDAETRAKIFDPFFTTKYTGRGLGLASVVGI